MLTQVIRFVFFVRQKHWLIECAGERVEMQIIR